MAKELLPVKMHVQRTTHVRKSVSIDVPWSVLRAALNEHLKIEIPEDASAQADALYADSLCDIDDKDHQLHVTWTSEETQNESSEV